MNLANLKRTLKFDYLTFLAITRSFFKDKNFLKYFGFIFTLYFIGMFAIIRANIYYIDDNTRAVSGDYQFWAKSSRHMTIHLSEFLNFGLPLLDFSPLQNLICIFLLSIASMILTKAINNKISYLALIASLFVGLNPYFLESLLFKFDSIYMCVGLFASIVPFLFVGRKTLFTLVSVGCILLMLTTYQSVNFIYLEIAMFLVFLKISNKRKVIDFAIFSVFSYFVAMIVFKLLIYKPIKIHVNTDTFAINDLFGGVMNNCIKFAGKIFSDWHATWFLYIGASLVVLSIVATVLKFKSIKSLLCFILFLIFGFIFSMGFYLLFVELKFDLRYIATFGVYVAIILIFLSGYINSLKAYNILKIFSIFLISYSAYGLLYISNSLGSAMQEQQKYVDFRTTLAIQDLLEFDNLHLQLVNFSGEIIAPSVENVRKKLKVLSILLNSTNNTTNQLGFRPMTRIVGRVNGSCEADALIKVKDNIFHTIKQYKNGCIDVNFKSLNLSENYAFISSNLAKMTLFDANVDKNLNLKIYKSNQKWSRKYIYVFEFSENIVKFARQNDDSLGFYFTSEKGQIFANKNIHNFTKDNDKFLYTVELDKMDIKEILIIFYNSKTQEGQLKFKINLKEPK
ncbi:glucosyltransferase domain-containing protein [Campylobacter sp. JMF_01 NE2]|uniref:glucosyltransferase domain-containing protein n=1 Tax=unclassified Campylobacter TaxID=2593542 RepID=UPI0022E9F11A|nr:MULTISPECIES: glucosyltransferase domain-containing protein [unclassified Campylobacter]MDA3052460.1 glucosyltransferase domain-containing protein [Campylobacter sp. JMF_03 NE3]MDA3066793.1 glucosyltransferase domain-containing protein [Campylobacter sp. JMF_01 NE2]